jgi:hypothetical protein
LKEPVLDVAYIRNSFHYVPFQIMEPSRTRVQEE